MKLAPVNQPHGRALAAASVAAAMASAAVISLIFAPGALPAGMGLLLLIYIAATLFAALHLLVLALPLYILLRERWPLLWWNAGLAGFAIAAIPYGALSFSFSLDLVRSAAAAVWLQWAIFSALIGLAGATGGIAFWAVLAAAGEKGDRA